MPRCRLQATIRLALLLGLLLGLGCVDPVAEAERFKTFEATTLGFLQDGRTTREEVVLKLGHPLGTFEGGRILTYEFARGPRGEWVPAASLGVGAWQLGVPPWPCSLVLVFGPDGVLARHSLVRGPQAPPAPPAGS